MATFEGIWGFVGLRAGFDLTLQRDWRVNKGFVIGVIWGVVKIMVPLGPDYNTAPNI